MLPTEALPEDWRMYYHNCWMRHKRYGIGQIALVGGAFYFYLWPGDKPDDEPQRIQANALEMWWPRPGAYNTPQGAVIIDRKSTRTMRKSACPAEHYFVSYGVCPNYNTMMHILRRGPNYVPVPEALEMFEKGLAQKLAVCREIILDTTRDDGIMVLYHGVEVGRYEGGTLVPHKPSPLTRRCEEKLARASVC